MTLFSRHLDEAAVWAAATDGDSLAPRDTAHVRSCARCAERCDTARLALADIRRDVHAQADQAIAPELLERQREAILRRVARIGVPGRVLAFPGRVAPRTERRLSPAWLVASAVMGLSLGLVSGRWLSDTAQPAVAPSTAVVLPGPLDFDGVAGQAPPDDSLLQEVEDAVEGHPRPEFDALDALTPVTYEKR